MKTRSIFLCIILSFLTCGFYSLYWMYEINNAANDIDNNYNYSFLTILLFSILTCGIYNLIWIYQMGKAFSYLPNTSDNSVLYLIISILGFPIIAFCLIQNDINNHINNMLYN